MRILVTETIGFIGYNLYKLVANIDAIGFVKIVHTDLIQDKILIGESLYLDQKQIDQNNFRNNE